jgi:5-methyltetrahydropteroyltriglutamate--homocysteine methyltransferase
MALTHNLGFPSMGARRELKQALEASWRREIDVQQLKDHRPKPFAKKLAAVKGSGSKPDTSWRFCLV